MTNSKLTLVLFIFALFPVTFFGMDAPVSKAEAETNKAIKEIDETQISFEQLEKLVAAGSITAQFELGCRYYEGIRGAARNPKAAAPLLQQAGAAGHASALFCFGLWCERNRQNAKACFARAAELGDLLAMFELACDKKKRARQQMQYFGLKK